MVDAVFFCENNLNDVSLHISRLTGNKLLNDR